MPIRRLPLVLAACAAPVTVHVAAAQPATTPIAQIRARYEYIQNPKTKLRVVNLTAGEGADAETIAYFEGKRLRKLVRRGLAAGDPVQQYFFWDNRLIFALDSRPPETAPDQPARQNRFYFDQGKLIRWVDASGNPVQPGGKKYRQYEAEFGRVGRFWLRAAEGRGGIFSSADGDIVNVSVP